MAAPTGAQGKHSGRRRGVLLPLISGLPAVVGTANMLLEYAGVPRSVRGVEQCGSLLFSQLYEALTGRRPPGASGGRSEAERCQAVVDALSLQLSPHISLDHIRGNELAVRDSWSICNLLDIFSGSPDVFLSSSVSNTYTLLIFSLSFVSTANYGKR